jgi:NAD(P)-dependent dehydrogenase (short-subunit alcohol dehydrogenase family)
VLNAGILFQGSIESTPDAAFRELVETNVTAVFRTARRAWPTLVENRASVVVIGSDTTIRGVHDLAAYSVSKAAVGAVSDLFAGEGARVGCARQLRLPGRRRARRAGDAEGHEDHAEKTRRSGCPRPAAASAGEDVAKLVSWLVGPESAHVNGATNPHRRRHGRRLPGGGRGRSERGARHAQLLDAMVQVLRQFEELLAELFPRGELPGVVHLSVGQEGVAVGVCSAMGRTTG